MPLEQGESSFGAVSSCGKSNIEMTKPICSRVDSWLYPQTTPFFRKFHCGVLISDTNLIPHQFLGATGQGWPSCPF